MSDGTPRAGPHAAVSGHRPPERAIPTRLLTIRLLGPVSIEVAAAPLAVDTRKAVALLAHLAVARRPAGRETLAALLWPESDDTAARGALRRTLSVLNAALGGAGLSIDRSAVALREAGVDVDLWRFQEALARARAHGHEADHGCPGCLAALDAAAALDRGEFMAGFSLRDSEAFDEWLLAEREAYRRELAGVLERLARGRAAVADWDGALDASRRWLALDPLHEPAHQLQMLVLARSGEPGAAVAQFRECVRMLDTELGVTPLRETTQLYEEIRAGRITPPATLAVHRAPPAAQHAGGTSPLVGRRAELDVLLGAHWSVGPSGRLLLIEGEPGIGKSRLAAAFAEAVRRPGGVVLEARAYPGEESIAFAALTTLLRAGMEAPGAADRLAGMAPEVLESVTRLMPSSIAVPEADRPHARVTRDTGGTPDPFARTRLIQGLAGALWMLVQGPVPGALVVDDLDWADASTVEVLAYLVRRLRDLPLSILVTWRPLEPADDERRRLLAAADHDGALVRVTPERLTRPDVSVLATAALGDRATDAVVDAIFTDSEGLPLFVAEVLAAGPDAIGSIPGGVLALLRNRVASTGEVAGQVLAAASVIGRSFTFETVRAASGRSEEEAIQGLEELIGHGLIAEVGLSDGDVRFDFTHARLRDVAYQSLGLVRRRLLHRRVAEALQAALATGEGHAGARWGQIAAHLDDAGRPTEAAEAHRRAGADALRVFANREAREQLEAALSLGHPATAELHETLGDVLTLLGDYAGAIAHLEAAVAAGRPDRESGVERRLALVYARLGDWSRAAGHAAAAIAAAPPDDRIRSALLADRSVILGQAGDATGAAETGRAALELAELARDAVAVARACQVLGSIARGRGELGQGRALLERAHAISSDLPDPGPRIAVLNTLALVEAAAGERARAVVLTGEALELCVRLGDRHRQAALENNLADLHRAEGREDEAMEHLKRAVAIFAEIEGRPGVLEPEIWKLVEW
jgi:DNA-binding SARP family transcriptional activator/tetratricopeptide (TPR) repeat protein